MQQSRKSEFILLLVSLLATTLLLSACAPKATVQPAAHTPIIPAFATPFVQAEPTFPADAFSDLPEEARTATRLGDPRPPAYWMLWNRCAEENRADWADENGGRAAGWTLMDDLIAYPGIQLGDYVLKDCPAGLALLQARTARGEETADPLYALASALLSAELNLGVGAETCPILEEAVVGGHMVLSSAGFNGEGSYKLSAEQASAVPRLVELLEGYNRGELCR